MVLSLGQIKGFQRKRRRLGSLRGRKVGIRSPATNLDFLELVSKLEIL